MMGMMGPSYEALVTILYPHNLVENWKILGLKQIIAWNHIPVILKLYWIIMFYFFDEYHFEHKTVMIRTFSNGDRCNARYYTDLDKWKMILKRYFYTM